MKSESVKERLLSLAIVLCLCRPSVAQEPNIAAEAVETLVEQPRQSPALPSTAAGRIGLYLIDVVSGEVTHAAGDPYRFPPRGSALSHSRTAAGSDECVSETMFRRRQVENHAHAAVAIPPCHRREPV
jgi:hypothetical protein